LTKDTIIIFVPNDDNETQTVNLPFDRLNTDDKLIVHLGKRYYLLAGFSYTARYNYGMFGPVGNRECKTSGFEHINGKPSLWGLLIKK